MSKHLRLGKGDSNLYDCACSTLRLAFCRTDGLLDKPPIHRASHNYEGVLFVSRLLHTIDAVLMFSAISIVKYVQKIGQSRCQVKAVGQDALRGLHAFLP
jgi:hypothetical protein